LEACTLGIAFEIAKNVRYILIECIYKCRIANTRKKEFFKCMQVNKKRSKAAGEKDFKNTTIQKPQFLYE